VEKRKEKKKIEEIREYNKKKCEKER